MKGHRDETEASSPDETKSVSLKEGTAGVTVNQCRADGSGETLSSGLRWGLRGLCHEDLCLRHVLLSLRAACEGKNTEQLHTENHRVALQLLFPPLPLRDSSKTLCLTNNSANPAVIFASLATSSRIALKVYVSSVHTHSLGIQPLTLASLALRCTV